MKIFDISEEISAKTLIYPGNPKVTTLRLKKIERDGSELSSLALGLHTGSHLDAPLHYVRKGKSVDRIPLERCLGSARVYDFTKIKTVITAKDASRIKFAVGEIVLFKTANSTRRSKKFDPKFVHIDETLARLLVRSKVKAVGIDGPSIRQFRLRPDTVHPLLLRSGITVYEGLRLDEVPVGRYFFIGLPLKISGREASPVRAVLMR